MSLKRKFESEYGATGPITAAQKIVEIVCTRKAKGKLKDRFWNEPEWQSFYKRQIREANSLMKIFDFGVIIESLQELPWVWSLATPKLKTLCVDKQKKVNRLNG